MHSPRVDKEVFVSQVKFLVISPKASKGDSLSTFCGFITRNFTLFTKLRSTLKRKFLVKEATKTLDNADAYRGFLTNYFAKISLFKEIHPYLVWAFHFSGFIIYSMLLLPWKQNRLCLVYACRCFL